MLLVNGRGQWFQTEVEIVTIMMRGRGSDNNKVQNACVSMSGVIPVPVALKQSMHGLF